MQNPSKVIRLAAKNSKNRVEFSSLKCTIAGLIILYMGKRLKW
jgi:hypothetical protein